jgi:glutamate--cysteine ligase
MLAEMYERSESFHYFAKRMSLKHNRYFRALDLNPERRRHFAEASEASLRRQQEIETADDISFAEYLARYFAQPTSGVPAMPG